MSARALRIEVERFPLREPFHITGRSVAAVDVVLATVKQDGYTGRGEAAGVYYREHDDAAGIVRQIETVRARIEEGIDRLSLQRLIRAGGARNALDCALWDLEAKLTRRAAWQIAGLEPPRALVTTFTVSANDPAKMASDASAYVEARAIKMKLTGQPIDADRVRAVRAARPDVWLGVDANQGYSREKLEKIMPLLVDSGVAVIEQPFPVGLEKELERFASPIPIVADESAQGLANLRSLPGRFDIVNIKLDKCGGFTEGLAMAREAQRLGLDVMIGNMIGTSLAMAPAWLIGQSCKIVDLDGPVFLSADRRPSVQYENGKIRCPEELWGAPPANRPGERL